MKKTIQLKVRKDLTPREQLHIIKLKGSLISKGYTEIIHIEDHDDEFHLNRFESTEKSVKEVQQYIDTFVNKENLADAISMNY